MAYALSLEFGVQNVYTSNPAVGNMSASVIARSCDRVSGGWKTHAVSTLESPAVMQPRLKDTPMNGTGWLTVGLVSVVLMLPTAGTAPGRRLQKVHGWEWL